jgi:hypothetical protein
MLYLCYCIDKGSRRLASCTVTDAVLMIGVNPIFVDSAAIQMGGPTANLTVRHASRLVAGPRSCQCPYHVCPYRANSYAQLIYDAHSTATGEQFSRA